MKRTEEYNLKVLHPELIKEWDFKKNQKKPEEYTHGSNQTIWWICKKGHSYEDTICHRTNKKNPRGCLYCSGKKPSPEYNLKILYPKLIKKEWDYDKNEKGPEEYTPSSSKEVHWKCKKGHFYPVKISSRTGKNKTGCPYCSGNKPSPEYNLKVLHPELIKEWDFDKNENGPEEYTPGSNQKVWWICKRGHSFESVIKDRTGGHGCKICSSMDRKRAKPDYNLKVLHPKLIKKEWDFDKNKKGPEEYTPGSQVKVWWICMNGHSHNQVIVSRIKGHKCRFCPKRQP